MAIYFAEPVAEDEVLGCIEVLADDVIIAGSFDSYAVDGLRTSAVFQASELLPHAQEITLHLNGVTDAARNAIRVAVSWFRVVADSFYHRRDRIGHDGR